MKQDTVLIKIKFISIVKKYSGKRKEVDVDLPHDPGQAIDLIVCLPAKRLMRSLMVVESNPLLDSCPGFRHRFIGFEIDFLVLQTAP